MASERCNRLGGLYDGKVLSRPDRLAKGDGPCGGRVRTDGEVSPRRDFWSNFSIAEGRCFGPSNIAEGQARRSTKEFDHHLSIARGSIAEVETQTLVAIRINYVTELEASKTLSLAAEVNKMVNALSNSLETRPPRS